MSEQSRKAFEAYWRERQLRTHRYIDRECPEDWGLAFKADAEAAWQASRAATLEEAASVCEDISDKYGDDEGGRWPELKSDAQTGARDCEAAIRALSQAMGLHGEPGAKTGESR